MSDTPKIDTSFGIEDGFYATGNKWVGNAVRVCQIKGSRLLIDGEDIDLCEFMEANPSQTFQRLIQFDRVREIVDSSIRILKHNCPDQSYPAIVLLCSILVPSGHRSPYDSNEEFTSK